MSIKSRISAVCELSNFFKAIAEQNAAVTDFNSKLKLAEIQNPWFTADNLNYCFKQWSEELTEEKITKWLADYNFFGEPKTVGIIMAGNIPLVGLHDLISVILSGHNAMVKTSSKDDVLMTAVIDFLKSQNDDLKNSISKVEKLENYQAVIATGSNNTARYFEFYFKDIPHIIRKNRTGVAVLDGNESEGNLNKLADDIFRYFGLGCRNVTHLFLPQNYNTDLLFEAFYGWKDIINHPKYANNYDYNRAIYLMEKQAFLDNNFVMLRKADEFHSPISVINYSFYDNLTQLKEKLIEKQDEIQCIVGKSFPEFENSVGFGQSQKPGLKDYADGVDVMKFLEFEN